MLMGLPQYLFSDYCGRYCTRSPIPHPQSLIWHVEPIWKGTNLFFYFFISFLYFFLFSGRRLEVLSPSRRSRERFLRGWPRARRSWVGSGRHRHRDTTNAAVPPSAALVSRPPLSSAAAPSHLRVKPARLPLLPRGDHLHDLRLDHLPHPRVVGAQPDVPLGQTDRPHNMGGPQAHTLYNSGRNVTGLTYSHRPHPPQAAILLGSQVHQQPPLHNLR
jgi:hypothetical protein